VGVGTLTLVYGADGTGKSTLTVDAIAHLAAGRDWLGIPVQRPVRVLVIENEGPPSLFQQKLLEKASTWFAQYGSVDWTANVFVYQSPWGEFSFADPAARAALSDFCDEHRIDLVTANPTLGLGVAATGRPDETQRFVDWLKECGLYATVGYWLLHHENKTGQISGDWGRHPDTKVQLQADGNRPRTKLVWEKTRWATLPTDEHPKALMLEWVVETKGYTAVELDTVGATDSELEARIDTYLTEHPLASTTAVETDVKGTASRIRTLLDSGRYDSVKGPRGARLWFLPSTPSSTYRDGVDGVGLDSA
jgi:AAA domain